MLQGEEVFYTLENKTKRRKENGRLYCKCFFFFAVFSLSYINYPRVHLNVFVAVCMSVNESDCVGRASVVSDELVPLPSGPVEDLNCSCNNNRH